MYQIWFKYMFQWLRSTHICFRHSFDDVTWINFRFVIISAWPCCIFPYNFLQDVFIQSNVIDIFIKFKMAAAANAILDFQYIWIWPFLRVDSVVCVFCTKFSSNICYSHWDRRNICYRRSFDVVTPINFRFWNLVQICLSNPELLIFSQN